jgi:hypothetical protein
MSLISCAFALETKTGIEMKHGYSKLACMVSKVCTSRHTHVQLKLYDGIKEAKGIIDTNLSNC